MLRRDGPGRSIFEKTMAHVQGAAAETVPEDIARQEGALQQRFQMMKNVFEPMCLQLQRIVCTRVHV